MAHYDTIIKNGTVFDGKGSKPVKADVAVKGEEIKKVEILKDGEYDADKIIDAEGKYVCPGFIDATNHSDTHWTLFSDPAQESLVRQGITTIIGGNCGSSIAPFVGEKGTRGIERWTDVSKNNINWQTMEELFSVLEKRKLGLNFATLVGVDTLIDSAGEDFSQVEFLLDESLNSGALGISTSLGVSRANTLNDKKLESLFKITAKHEGITKHHLEDEGKDILPAISRLIQMARKSGADLHLSHFKVLGKGSWPLFSSAVNIMRNARGEGVNLTLDFFPYSRTGSDLFMLLPNWLRKMGKESVLEILNSAGSEKRDEVIKHLKDITLHYDKIIVASSSSAAANAGKSLMELSALMETEPEELILNLLSVNDLRVSIFSEVISFGHIKELAKEDYSIMASDGVGYDNKIFKPKNDLPHPRSFGAFPRAMRMLVKEDSILSWEQMINKMTGLPAEIFKIKDRGTLSEGKKADVVVFDPETVSDYATYEDPFQYSKGIEQVLINGSVALDNGKPAGKFSGQVLRKK
ncbi:MAG: amidohydrolase family protein [bacterium]|nr:amidohydrolase family protein [bacterium]